MEREVRRKIYTEINNIKREHKSFKRRVSVIANLIIPGIGFALYGSDILKGLISFILFFSYNLFFFKVIVNITDMATAVIYYVPAVVIWIASAAMVSSLDD